MDNYVTLHKKFGVIDFCLCVLIIDFAKSA
jgi:hypothetical protein